MRDGSSQGGVESRASARTNLFLAATLGSAGANHPVKIRDLSATGARIETSVALKVGGAVTLVRGALSIDARVGWRAERFCGLSFAAPVSIEDWMANPVTLQRPPGSPGLSTQALVATPVRWTGDGGSVADELGHASRWLAGFGQSLGTDPHVVFNHGSELFSLGLVARALGAMAETMQAEAFASEPSPGRQRRPSA
jgi:hypothetical protein